MSPDFEKYFILYTFASGFSYAVVLTQKNSKGFEVPISFMSSCLQVVELKYLGIYKQSYVVFKAVKHFSQYLLSHIQRSHYHILQLETCWFKRNWELKEQIG
jgi:hypothetical protein